MDKEIQNLLENGSLEMSSSPTGFISPVFLVPKEGGKVRPVVNLKRLNLFLNPKRFRLINYQKIPEFLQKDDYLMKIDLHNAYLHIPIHGPHRRFLSISYKWKMYQMTSLPFGISTAPLVFARITNWIAQILRAQGIRLVVYLDDFLLANQDPRRLEQQAQAAVKLLTELGFIINKEKTTRSPAAMVEYLGIMWDCHKAQKGISQTKVHRIRQQVRKLTQKGFWTWREARALLGRLNFAAFVIPLGRLHCRRAQRASNRIPQFSKRRYTIPKAVIQDLHWWLRNVDQSSLIWVLKKMSYLTTDASDWGWGATLNDLVRRPEIGGLEGSGWSAQVAGWMQEDIDLLESSWRSSTLHSYKSAWNRWRTWTQRNKIDSVNPKPKDLAQFLCYLFRYYGEPIKLPENLESLPRADHFPTQRHRWNTNEVSRWSFDDVTMSGFVDSLRWR
nr:unnamed protein product [Callosobruchus analis]